MAEFCKECFLKEFDIDLKKQKVIISKDLDLCETCGLMKPAVIKIVYKNPIRRLLIRIRGY